MKNTNNSSSVDIRVSSNLAGNGTGDNYNKKKKMFVEGFTGVHSTRAFGFVMMLRSYF